MELLARTQILPLKCLRKRLAWQGDTLAGLFCAWRGHLDLDGGESNSRVFKWLIKLSRLLLHAIHFQLFFPIKCNQQIFVKRLVRELKQHSRKGKKLLSRNRGIYLGFVWVTRGSEAKGNEEHWLTAKSMATVISRALHFLAAFFDNSGFLETWHLLSLRFLHIKQFALWTNRQRFGLCYSAFRLIFSPLRRRKQQSKCSKGIRAPVCVSYSSALNSRQWSEQWGIMDTEVLVGTLFELSSLLALPIKFTSLVSILPWAKGSCFWTTSYDSQALLVILHFHDLGSWN